MKDDLPKPTKVCANLATIIIREASGIKTWLSSLEESIFTLFGTLDKVLQHTKDTRNDVGKLRLSLDHLKQEQVETINKLMKKADFTSMEVSSSHNQLAISV